MATIMQDQPLYLQVENEIRQRIATGEYAVNSQIPSEEELCDAFGVSRITVRRSVQDLVELGLLRKCRGRGTFVAVPKNVVEPARGDGGFSTFVVDTNRSLPRRILGKQILPADERMASRLGMSVGDEVLNVRRLMTEGDAPMAIDSLYVSARRFPNLLRELSGDASFYHILREQYHVSLGDSELVMDVSTARPDEARLLGCIVGSPLFILQKDKRDADGAPLHYSKTIIRGDRVTYHFSVSRDGVIKARS